MAVLGSLLRAVSVSVQQTLTQAKLSRSSFVNSEEVDGAEGFYNSTHELLSGLEVTEHTAPAALVDLLHDALRR